VTLIAAISPKSKCSEKLDFYIALVEKLIKTYMLHARTITHVTVMFVTVVVNQTS